MGEVSPRLHGRTDVGQFKQACEEITNMFVYPQGGAARRPGTQFLSDEFSDQAAVRNITFKKSKTESYVIIFTLDLSESYGIKIWDVTNKEFINVNVAAHDSAYADRPVRRWTGFTTELELQQIQFEQFGNAIFFTQENHPPFAIDFASVLDDDTAYVFPYWNYRKIGQRDSSGDLLYSSAEEIADSTPYTDRNTSALTMTVSATTGVISITSGGIFLPEHVGTLIRMTGDSNVTTGVALITAVTNEEDATGIVLRAFEDLNPSANWAFSSWNDVFGWPKALTFFENRLIYGYTRTDPNMFWASKIGRLDFMRQEQFIDETPLGVTNEMAWSGRIPGGETNIIQWLAGRRTLIIGALGQEIIGEGPDNTLAMGPLNFNFYSETSHGSAQVQPIRKDSILIFVQRSGRMLRELTFNFDEDTFKAPPIMIFAEHMPRKTQMLVVDSAVSNGQIVEMCLQEADNGILFCRDSNGGFFGMTRDRDSEGQPTAFHYHQIAGLTILTPGAKVLSMCVAPSSDGTHDDIYLSVRRAWGEGPDRTYFEKIGREYEHDDIYNPWFETIEEKPVYLDSAAYSLEGVATSVHGGFDHLINSGSVIHAVADGKYVGPVEVNEDGEITLDTPAFEVIAGMYYRSQLVPVQANLGSVLGTSQGADKTIDQVFIRFVRTIGGSLGFKFGNKIDENQMIDIEFREPGDDQDTPIALFTGEKELTPPLGYHTKLCVVIRQDLPFPQHVACVVTRGVTND